MVCSRQPDSWIKKERTRSTDYNHPNKFKENKGENEEETRKTIEWELIN
jgi:hypothetical protein